MQQDVMLQPGSIVGREDKSLKSVSGREVERALITVEQSRRGGGHRQPWWPQQVRSLSTFSIN
jgi:hypothetical protein